MVTSFAYCPLHTLTLRGGGALDYSLWIGGVQHRVAYPYPSQTKISHPSQKKRVKLHNPCQNFGSKPGSKHTPWPCQTVGLKTTPFPCRHKVWKTYPWGRRIPSTHSIARAPPPPLRADTADTALWVSHDGPQTWSRSAFVSHQAARKVICTLWGCCHRISWRNLYGFMDFWL